MYLKFKIKVKKRQLYILLDIVNSFLFYCRVKPVSGIEFII